VTAEEVARKFEYSRGDLELVGYEEVALPFYRIRLRAYTLERKPIPPIEEFALKAVGVGLKSPGELAGALGLHERIVATAVSNLIRSEDVYFGASEGDRAHTLAVTAKGRQTLVDAELIVPQQGTFEVDFDGLLRCVTSYRREVSHAARDLANVGLIEVEASPVRPPELKDLDGQQVAREVAALSGRVKRELVSVTALEKRIRLFRPAVALIFQSKVAERTEVAIAVNGRLSAEYEMAFAAAGGPTRLGMDRPRRPVESETLPGTDPSVAPEAVKSVEAIRQEIATAREAVEAARDDVNRAAGVAELASARESLAELEEKYQQAVRALEAVDVRYLKVFDHPPLLEEALTQAKERLMIISPWIGACVVDGAFLKKIARLCAAGVKVYIGYGIGDDQGRRRSPRDEDAEKRLNDLAKSVQNLTVKNFGNTHAKMLAYDRTFVALTSFNWLSFKGSRERGYRDEQGILLRIAEKVDQKFAEEAGRFAAPV
jgi:hypothetical protein